MAAKMNSTTRLNRQALDAITLGFADALGELAVRVLDAAAPNVPDEPPYGKGLVETGDWGVWVRGKKVAGGARKPKGQIKPADGIVMVVGYGWPGHYAEEGTIHEPARPFLTPAVLQTMPDSGGVMKDQVGQRLRSVK
jgi:hypothetical protein